MGKIEVSSVQVGHGVKPEAIEAELTYIHEGIASREGEILAKYVLRCTVETNPEGELESDDPAATQEQERLFVVTYIPDEIEDLHRRLSGF